ECPCSSRLLEWQIDAGPLIRPSIGTKVRPVQRSLEIVHAIFLDAAAPSNHASFVDYSERIHRLVQDERQWTSSPAAAEVYSRFHARRFEITFRSCCELAPNPNSVVCDVGRGTFTERLAQRYAQVWSLGFALDADDGGHRGRGALPDVRHIPFDLNTSVNVESWPSEQVRFDLIVCAE